MTRYLITKRTLQVLAVLVGLVGGSFVYTSVLCLFVFAPFRDGVGGVLLLLSTVLDLLLGGIFLGVAYKVLRDFSPGAIRYLLVILAFIFFLLLGRVLEPLHRILVERDAQGLEGIVLLLPIIPPWLSYKIMTAMVTVGLRREEPPTGESEQAPLRDKEGHVTDIWKNPAARVDNPLGKMEFHEILAKIIGHLRKDKAAESSSLEELKACGVVGEADCEYLRKHNIHYKPPATAGPYQNFVALFTVEVTHGSSHILHSLVDESQPDITRVGNLSNLAENLSIWFHFPSDMKHLDVRDKNLLYLSVSFCNNEFWDKTYLFSPHVEAGGEAQFAAIRAICTEYGAVLHGDHTSGKHRSVYFVLPSDLNSITRICDRTLREIYNITPDSPIRYYANGFRFPVADAPAS